MVVIALRLVYRTKVAIENRLGQDFGKDKMQLIWMGYLIQEQLQVTRVTYGLGHLPNCLLVVGGQDLICQVGELAHFKR